MRKTYLLLAMALLLGACQREQDFDAGPPQNRLTARMEGDSKTVLNPAGAGISHILWAEGDRLAVSIDGSAKTSVFTLSEGAGTREAVFTGMGKGDNYTAVYPAGIVTGWDGNGVYVNLPVEQKRETGSFGPGAYPMAASGNSNLEFRNIASILKLSLKGKQTIQRIVFRPNEPGLGVSGHARISLATPYEPVLEMMPEAIDSVVLVTGGVTLREDVPIDFYLVVPAQTYKGGFTVTIRSASDYMEQSYGADFTMRRSELHAADPIKVLMNAEVEVSSFLHGTGTEKDPLRIDSQADLLLLAQAVNARADIPTDTDMEVPAADAHYLLTADIDLSSYCSAAKRRNWTPIGGEGISFNGHFDGGGHRISGLFIDRQFLPEDTAPMEQGLFGYGGSTDAVIENLTVEGTIKDIGDFAGLVVGYFNGTLLHCYSEGNLDCVAGSGSAIGGLAGHGGWRTEGCINRADVAGLSQTGGIAGYAMGDVINCFNYGTIEGGSDTGGIMGVSDALVYGCRNFGPVTGSRDLSSCTGGIVGNQNYGKIVACRNEGPVSGFQWAGGISGYSRQGSFVWNCVNRGKVAGTRQVGGLVGSLSSNSSGWGFATTLRGCLNLGEVEPGVEAENVGALCGELDGGDPSVLDSESSWNAWLYDPEEGLGMKEAYGVVKGKTEQVRSFTYTEMRKAGDGSALLWLNSWTGGHVNGLEGCQLQGWVKDPDDGLPSLSGLPAQEPGFEKAIFTVTADDAAFNVPGGELKVSVYSSLSFKVETPSWIEQTDVISYETDPFNSLYVFLVKPNDGGASRTGAIRFVNEEGTERRVTVRQREPYLRIDKDQMVMTGPGGSQRLQLTTSMAWTASSDAAWCRVGPSEGVGDQLMAVRALENPDKAARMATVTIASTDGSRQAILTVVQGGSEETETGDWRTQPFVHQSLAMRFTATWCGWCPRMNRTVHKAMELYPGHILHLALHEPGSDLPFRDVEPLQSQYGAWGFPTGIIDGRQKIDNDETSKAAPILVDIVKETESVYGTHTGVDISSKAEGRNVDIDVNAYVKTAGDYKITVLLVEDGIIHSQSDYEEGTHDNYVHDDVARVAVTSVLGDPFSIDKDFTVKSFHYSLSVPSPYVVESLRVFVYVQKSFGSAPRIQNGNFGDYYVDNCGTAMVGGRLRLALEGDSGGSGGGDEGEGNEGIVPGDDINLK